VSLGLLKRCYIAGAMSGSFFNKSSAMQNAATSLARCQAAFLTIPRQKDAL